ncbi:hypothetical protein Zmor_021369 [Zophobas morio]|uniref:Transposable element Tc3 transposase n=1 Tax=Zophobas morio TaxID=2755281 RepID=A0AA38I6B9_9CUCU|nr:hypothetical protein Zmor_021369 [Zophobas morio]
MPSLNEVQKQTIAQRLRDGVSIRTIPTELHISKNTVLLAKKKINEYGRIIRRAGSGRPKKTTADENIQMANFIREYPFETVVNARQQTNFPASLKTARKRVHETELRNRAAANKIFLTEQNKANRVLFAQEFVNEPADMWNNVIFSDEKTFKSYSNGRRRVYRPPGTRYDERYCNKYKQSGRFSVNVWGWVSSRGRGICAIVEERLNANVYRRLLEELMLPSVIPVFGERNFIFQQDNCPVHNARLVSRYLEAEGVHVLPWPSRSPDLNVIENVWGEMQKYIYQNDFRPRNPLELQEKIVEAWETVTPGYMRQLVASMPRRLQNVIDANGAMTKY